MTTRYVLACDGLRIAYDVAGKGPALLLLHGFNNDRTMWHEHGYVERLHDQFTVITIRSARLRRKRRARRSSGIHRR